MSDNMHEESEMKTPRCPDCGGEIVVGAAKGGGGYELLCRDCEWKVTVWPQMFRNDFADDGGAQTFSDVGQQLDAMKAYYDQVQKRVKENNGPGTD